MDTRASYKPFIKWAGGKRNLVSTLASLAPTQISRYVEPFVGGGAFFFALKSEGHFESAELADLNEHLMMTYRVVQDLPHELVSELVSGKYVPTPEVYYQIRAENPTSPVERAARFIYLNKHCYNGLWRVNARGLYNVPFSQRAIRNTPTSIGLLSSSMALRGVRLTCDDFETVCAFTQYGDFVYCDPPYHGSFNKYTRGGFTDADHIRLARVVRQMDARGVSVMVSNSNTEFVRELYSGFDVTEVQSPRAINRDPTKRGKVTELVIRNYT